MLKVNIYQCLHQHFLDTLILVFLVFIQYSLDLPNNLKYYYF